MTEYVNYIISYLLLRKIQKVACHNTLRVLKYICDSSDLSLQQLNTCKIPHIVGEECHHICFRPSKSLIFPRAPSRASNSLLFQPFLSKRYTEHVLHDRKWTLFQEECFVWSGSNLCVKENWDQYSTWQWGGCKSWEDGGHLQKRSWFCYSNG